MKHRDRRGPYRSRSGLLFGVCAGFAEYFDLSVFWTRIIVLGAFIMTGFWPVGVLYVVAGLLMKKDPQRSFGSECRWREGARHANSPPPLHKRPGSLDERIRNLEDIVTSKAYDWDARLRSS